MKMQPNYTRCGRCLPYAPGEMASNCLFRSRRRIRLILNRNGCSMGSSASYLYESQISRSEIDLWFKNNQPCYRGSELPSWCLAFDQQHISVGHLSSIIYNISITFFLKLIINTLSFKLINFLIIKPTDYTYFSILFFCLCFSPYVRFSGHFDTTLHYLQILQYSTCIMNTCVKDMSQGSQMDPWHISSPCKLSNGKVCK